MSLDEEASGVGLHALFYGLSGGKFSDWLDFGPEIIVSWTLVGVKLHKGARQCSGDNYGVCCSTCAVSHLPSISLTYLFATFSPCRAASVSMDANGYRLLVEFEEDQSLSLDVRRLG